MRLRDCLLCCTFQHLFKGSVFVGTQTYSGKNTAVLLAKIYDTEHFKPMLCSIKNKHLSPNSIDCFSLEKHNIFAYFNFPSYVIPFFVYCSIYMKKCEKKEARWKEATAVEKGENTPENLFFKNSFSLRESVENWSKTKFTSYFVA